MIKLAKLTTLPLLAIVAALAGCDDGNGMDAAMSPAPPPVAAAPAPTPAPASTAFVGAVYAGTNRRDGNNIAAFGRAADGTLTPIAQYATGGLGGAFDDGNGLDPLISEDSLVAVGDRFLLAVNAGSNTVTSFRINADFSLTVAGTASTGGVGPVSIAYRNGLVYVANVDSDGVFAGPPDQSGNVTGLRLDLTSGGLTAIDGSTRQLGARPSDIEFSPDGRNLVVSAVNAGSTMLAGRSTAELTSYGVASDGRLTAAARSMAASTLPGNAAGRNLPTSIGIEVVERAGRTVVIATEAREFLPSGAPGMLAMFQTGSVSTWELGGDGAFTARSQDLMTGPSLTGGPTSACWITVSPDRTLFWVTSASGATISTYRLDPSGTASLIDGRAAAGAAAEPGAPNPLANADGFVDVAVSGDGRFIYQLLVLRGTINVYGVGSGGSLNRLQQATGLLPRTNIQGLVTVDRPST